MNKKKTHNHDKLNNIPVTHEYSFDKYFSNVGEEKDAVMAHVVKRKNICHQQHKMLKHGAYYGDLRHIIMMDRKHNTDKSTPSRPVRSITDIQRIKQT